MSPKPHHAASSRSLGYAGCGGGREGTRPESVASLRSYRLVGIHYRREICRNELIDVLPGRPAHCLLIPESQGVKSRGCLVLLAESPVWKLLNVLVRDQCKVATQSDEAKVIFGFTDGAASDLHQSPIEASRRGLTVRKSMLDCILSDKLISNHALDAGSVLIGSCYRDG